MLFSSYTFLLVLLPITLLVYYLISKSRHSRIFGIIWLIIASLVFYAWANPYYLVLLISSVVFNYIIGIKIGSTHHPKHNKIYTTAGVTANILLLIYFKYTNFFLDNINKMGDIKLNLNTLVLPLAISFFTLQQIAYLVDIYRGEPRKHGFWEYCLFVCFFPKLLSGPIVRLKQMIPQIGQGYKPIITSQNLAIGLISLLLGLVKKVIIADNLGTFADPIFHASSLGTEISFVHAWAGSLAYTMQIYFDFSGYCDMAIGLGLMFGIRLPLNFYSPYKATSIIDFWRRWHITLSSFIRDYIYIPLGGNRKGLLSQMIFLLIAMTIAGLWHGGGWTFIIWGTLHGLYLVINHVYRRIIKAKHSTRVSTLVSILVTFIAVTIAWVFFRADSVSSGLSIIMSMVGVNGFHLPVTYLGALGPIGEVLNQLGVSFDILLLADFPLRHCILAILVGLGICWFLPNAQEYLSNYQASLDSFSGIVGKPRFPWLRWKPALINAVFFALLSVYVLSSLAQVSQFIYFQF
jgi:alginate O-acetyltransferase complex protein AlgI